MASWRLTDEHDLPGPVRAARWQWINAAEDWLALNGVAGLGTAPARGDLAVQRGERVVVGSYGGHTPTFVRGRVRYYAGRRCVAARTGTRGLSCWGWALAAQTAVEVQEQRRAGEHGAWDHAGEVPGEVDGKRQPRVQTDQEEAEVWYPGQPAPDNQCDHPNDSA